MTAEPSPLPAGVAWSSPQEWPLNGASYQVRRVFTFGHGQPNFPGYTVVYGISAVECRDRMYQAYGQKWSMEYLDEETAGVERWNLPLIATLGLPLGGPSQ